MKAPENSFNFSLSTFWVDFLNCKNGFRNGWARVAAIGGNNDDGVMGEMVLFSRDLQSYICKMYSTFSECANAMREKLRIANCVMFPSPEYKNDIQQVNTERDEWKERASAGCGGQVTSEHFLILRTPRGFTWLCANSTETRFRYNFFSFIFIYTFGCNGLKEARNFLIISSR